MIHSYLIIAILSAFSVLILVMLGQKLRIAYPIFLVIAGLLISFIPGMPSVEIEPDLVFLIFLPPILFEAAWYTSWKDFAQWRKPIFSLAVGLVIITSTVVALVSNALIPGMTLALGFLLGGINSPPDAVAATSILKHMKLPRRIMAILEGESLVNDASSLIVFKFALAAVMTGQFILMNAVVDFFVIAGMGIIIGLSLGMLFSWLMRWLPSNSNIDTVLTLLIPYILYITAEYFHFSGVMAVVSGGLLMSYNANCFLSHTTRIQAGSVWNTLIFMLNAVVFMIIGLELPVVIEGMKEYSLWDGVFYAIVIGGVIILTRTLYIFLLSYFPAVMHYKHEKRPARPEWQEPFIMSISAMRGVVSLASALAIPFLLADGTAFPQRNLILFVTFVIILITLVGQGLLLPLILKFVKVTELTEGLPEEKQEALILHRLKNKALNTITADYKDVVKHNSLVNHMKISLENEVGLINDKMQCIHTNEGHTEAMGQSREVYRGLLRAQRRELMAIRSERRYDDNVIRSLEMQLDLDEVKITGFEH